MGIGHSPRECSPLHHGEVPTHTGAFHINAVFLGFNLFANKSFFFILNLFLFKNNQYFV